MSQTDLEKFLETAITLERGPAEIPRGTIDGVELTGDALIAAAVAKGKELGYELINEDVVNWIKLQIKPGTAEAFSERNLDDIAAAFKKRDKLWSDSR